MKITINAGRDNISAALKQLATPAARTALMEAIGGGLVSTTKRAFEEPSLRPAPWPARKSGGSHALLKLSGTLQRGIAITSLSTNRVSVSSNRIYAAIHQFGGTIKPRNAGGVLAFQIGGKKVFAKSVTIPARPFFPVQGNSLTARAKEQIAAIVKLKLKSLAGQI